MPAVNTADFDADVARALSLIGVTPQTPALDALVDLRGAAAALAEASPSAAEPIVLRVAPELGSASPGYSPRPGEPLWIRLHPGTPDLTIAPLRRREDAPNEPRRTRARSVVVDKITRPCCEAPSCKNERHIASVWIELDDDASASKPRLLAAQARELDPQRALQKAGAFAAPLARLLAVTLVVDGAPAEPAEILAAAEVYLKLDPGDLPLPRLPASELARFALRSEGDRVVVRDHASVGPKLSARRTIVIGVVLLVAAVAVAIIAAKNLSGEGRNASLALAAVAALVALTGYAFLGVGRFAARYAAKSAPLLAFGVDRMIVAPWVARDGAVDLRLEGRLGAAIPVGEVRAAYVRVDEGVPVVEIETDHGPFDGLTCESKDTADVFCEAIRSAIDDVRHPKVGASARQRARAKVHA